MVAIFRYSLTQAPEARTDGSGCVDHDIKAQYNIDDAGWLDAPNYHKTISVPTAELETILAMPTGAAKNTAYKQALIDNRNTTPIPDPQPQATDWSKEGIEEYITIEYATWKARFDATNTATSQAASGADEYITVTLGQSYPVPFQL